MGAKKLTRGLPRGRGGVVMQTPLRSNNRRGITVVGRRTSATPLQIQPHPETGARYVVVLPTHASVLQEHREGWKLNERPWLRVIPSSSFQSAFFQLRDQRALFCNWLLWEAAWLPRDRKASVVTLYAEALDDDITKLMPQHRQWLGTFLAHAREFDGVLAHTPWMAQKLTALSGLRSEVLPTGYDPRVLGTPRWSEPKIADAAWYGTMVGKRPHLVRRIKAIMGSRFADLSNTMSRALVDKIQRAKTLLYLGHSNVRSYSTWRTWHAICSSAALVTEPGDYWPLTKECCIEIPTIDERNIDDVARRIVDLDPQEALRLARAAHESLAEYTVANMIDKYLVPKTEAWLR